MYLSKVYLLPECRGQGVVRRMFQFVEEETKKEGLSKIRLTVNKQNTHAYQVYEHYGYDNVEIRQGGHRLRLLHGRLRHGEARMRPGESLESLSRDQLLELLSIYSKNWLAMDGVWFQSVERKFGMDEAMYHDVEAWKRFTVTEARRIKRFLNLPEHPGLDGLAEALRFRVLRQPESLRDQAGGKIPCCTG